MTTKGDPTEAVLLFQQESDDDLRRPWPVTVDNADHMHDILHGGHTDAVRLIGFEGKHGTVEVFAGDAYANPELAVGLTPVYLGKNGGLFSAGNPVESARLADLDAGRLRRENAARVAAL